MIELHSVPYINIGFPLTHRNKNTIMYCVFVGLILFGISKQHIVAKFNFRQ